jgi:hypothetical protein
MAWSVDAVGTASFANNADVTPTNPAHSSGDILLGIAVFRNKTVAAGELITETVGWTQLYDAIGIAVFGKVAASGSETNPTFQFSGGSAGDTTGAVVLTTSGGSLTVEDSAGLDNSTSTDITFPATTIATNDCLCLDIACLNDNFSVTPTATWTERVDAGTTVGTDIQFFVQTLIQTTAASLSSHVAVATTTAANQTASVILQPAAATSGILPSGIQMGNINSGIFE